MTYQHSLRLETSGHRDMHDITARVTEVVRRSGVEAGLVHVFNVGSTAAIGAIEFEPGLRRDLPEVLDRLFPPSREYGHEQAWHDGNGHSHVRAALLGPSLVVPIRDGRPVTGTWQQLVLVDFDNRARDRTWTVTVIGE